MTTNMTPGPGPSRKEQGERIALTGHGISSLASRKARRRVIAGIGLGLTLAALVTIPLEFAYRLLRTGALHDPGRMWTPDPRLLYRLDPSNPDTPGGFRAHGHLGDREAGLRVLCLGGSTTFGHGVAAREAWPAALERELSKFGLRSHVINAGVPGYGSRQLLLRYRFELWKVPADVVVIYSGWNRTGALVDADEWMPMSVARAGDTTVRKAFAALAGRSQIVRDATMAWMRIATRVRPDPWHPDRYHETFAADLDTLVGEIQDDGGLPVLVLFPSLLHAEMTPEEIEAFEPLLWERHRYHPQMLDEIERKHAAISEIGSRRGVPLVECHRAIGGLREQERVALFLDQMHPTERGHDLIGELVAAEIIRYFDSRDGRVGAVLSSNAVVRGG